MVRGGMRGRRDMRGGPRMPFKKPFLPRPPFDLTRFDMAFQRDSTSTSDDTELTNVSSWNKSISATFVMFKYCLCLHFLGFIETQSRFDTKST